ncbi:hypothetical protein Tco_0399817 [Tanacetum coccineum]
MSKAFRAKAKAEREIRVDHILQYSMLRDYVVELQSTNPNTNVKITVERNTDPSLPTRMFQRIYVCLGALKLGFKACIRDLLGLDGTFMNGTFPGQVLVADGLDLNNGIYPLAYALVKAERIPCKHVVAPCWNMALNDRAAPPPETWVGRTRKKRKRSKHEDEPFVKDGKLIRKGRTITCQSCENTGHNKATCKGQGQKATTGGNNTEASGLSTAAGEGGQGGAGVSSQGSSHSRWTKSRVQTERMSPQKRTPTQPTSQPSTSSQVPVGESRSANGREIGDGVPTQSSAAVGASEWSFL